MNFTMASSAAPIPSSTPKIAGTIRSKNPLKGAVEVLPVRTSYAPDSTEMTSCGMARFLEKYRAFPRCLLHEVLKQRVAKSLLLVVN